MTSPDSPLRIAVFGGQGLGGLAVQTVLNLGRSGRPYTFAGYLNDRQPVGSALYAGKVLCSFDEWRRLDRDVCFVAPLYKAGCMQEYSARVAGLQIPDARWVKLIDPGAAVADDVRIGAASIFSALATIGPESSIGAHCFIRSGVTVGHDNVLGDFVFVGANATLCGGCCIGSGAHIAPGASVREFVTVGRFAVVGLGAVVTKDVPDYSIVAGNPARVRGEVAKIEHPS
jgi:acetyltransferase EpsM